MGFMVDRVPVEQVSYQVFLCSVIHIVTPVLHTRFFNRPPMLHEVNKERN
jgi:hypothetical protein